MTTCPYAVFSRDPDTVDRHLQRYVLELATEAVDPRMERHAGMAMEESIAA
jgi:hypothetical protein